MPRESVSQDQPVTGPGTVEQVPAAQAATPSQSSGRPSVVTQPGTRAQRLWLLGDSFVRRAGERASWTGNHNLGVNASEVKWFGRGGLTLHEFPRALQDLLRYNPAPTIMIIHVGSNDLGRYGAKQCRQALDDALTTARELLPGCHISFSSIIPRLFYYGYGRTVHSQSAIDKVRKSLNKYGRRKIRHGGSSRKNTNTSTGTGYTCRTVDVTS
ncbi:uncharacterized protein LOC115920633 [Strongylocentrotus purpuratus]|uniref:SGNH hydrolase-type esterase domain-containing protein n=1 Tax=Strongylocentrotus purpuratus TaxID=7668 RepID=A0A7M7N8G4_STRPU|nr:uncharacterized protein LOC115920633 [Strongylocentrotus purpuratus]